jgi:Tfp pilus assembly protein PilE
MLKTKRGQSMLEYAILIVIVIAALITLQAYIKRGIQGRLKSASDDIGEQFTTNSNYKYNKTVTTKSNTTEKAYQGSTNTQTHYANTTTNAWANGLNSAEGTWHY